MTTSYANFAALYDTLMDDVNYPAWLEHYRALLQLSPGEKLVDLACGTGAFSIPLAKQGFAVTGVDISRNMLSLAQEKARQAGARLQFICQDMQALQLPSRVSAVMCGCDGINYLRDEQSLRRCFAAVYAALRPGGRFCFDVSTREKLQAMAGQMYGEDRDDVSYMWFNEYNPQRQLLTMDLSFFVRQENGLYARFSETHVQRGHTKEELQSALHEAGFADCRFYSEHTMSPAQAGDMRMHIVCKK